MKKIPILAALAVMIAAPNVFASLTVVIENPNPRQVVHITVDPVGASAVTHFSGNVLAGIYNESINGVSTPSFCIDVAHDVSVGDTYNDYEYAALEDAPASPAGPMGTTTAISIEKLWAAYYSAAQSDGSGVTAAALQVAIWETEGNGQLLGNNTDGYTVAASGNTAVTDEVNTMLANLPNLTQRADLIAIVSPDAQSYVIAVPEASTVMAGLLLLLPLGASTFRIFHRNRNESQK